jgi:hypothetical protein
VITSLAGNPDAVRWTVVGEFDFVIFKGYGSGPLNQNKRHFSPRSLVIIVPALMSRSPLAALPTFQQSVQPLYPSSTREKRVKRVTFEAKGTITIPLH